MADQTEEKAGPRSFVVMLRELANGEAEARLSRDMQRLLERVHEEAVTTNGIVKGKLKLVISVAIDEGGNAVLRYSSDIAEPTRKTMTTHMFVDKHSRLTPQNPKQTDMWGKKKAEALPASKETNDIGTPAGPAQGV